MMNYTLKPSLEHIVLVKIATTLWNEDNIRALMSKFNFLLSISERRTEWQEIENNVIEKVLQLSLPKSLKDEILGFIKPVGLRILQWKEYHQEESCLCKSLPNEFCWTPQGTVDLKKTAETLIKDESLDVTSRYKLACIYCLEDDVLELWNKVPENQRKFFYCEKYLMKVSQNPLVVLWTYYIRGSINNQYTFERAAVGGNKVGTEYFLQKLTPREREESLVSTAQCIARSYFITPHYEADVLFFLLSQMDEEQQIEVFKSNPYQVLKWLLEWPLQCVFVETANRMWDFLSKEDYEWLLSNIVDKVKKGYKDYDYQELFREFWQLSPYAHKRYVIDKFASGTKSIYSLLSKLLVIWDKEHINEKELRKNVTLILKDATLIEKRKLIFSNGGQEICQGLICDDEWDSLQFFARECISSKDEMIKFKEEFEERLTWRCSKEKFAEKKDKFFQLLDDFINGYNKRKNVAEGDSSSAKRLHSTEFEEVTHGMKK